MIKLDRIICRCPETGPILVLFLIGLHFGDEVKISCHRNLQQTNINQDGAEVPGNILIKEILS